jgi:hypothetical protein
VRTFETVAEDAVNGSALKMKGHNCWGAMAAPVVEIEVSIEDDEGKALGKIIMKAEDLEAMLKDATTEALGLY